MSARRSLPLVGRAREGVFAFALLLSACGGAAASSPATGSSPSSELQAQIIATELTVGPQQRIPIGITDHNTPVSDASVHVRSFLLVNGSEAVFKGASDAPFKGQGLQGGGLYVAHVDLSQAGNWGLEVTASRPNGSHLSQQLAFNVTSHPVVPAVGQPAPLSNSPTVQTNPDVTTIDTGNPPDDMHQLSIAQAIEQHRPTLVVFASPAFCTSRACGPEVQAIQGLEPAYRDRLTFIHVEIYTNYKPDPSKRTIAATVTEWRLQTEPWVFLIDSGGIIRARFEGPTAADELQAAINQLLG